MPERSWGSNLPDRPSPYRLWRQAHREHPDDQMAARERYRDLMIEYGFIVTRCQHVDGQGRRCELAAHDGDHSYEYRHTP